MPDRSLDERPSGAVFGGARSEGLRRYRTPRTTQSDADAVVAHADPATDADRIDEQRRRSAAFGAIRQAIDAAGYSGLFMVNTISSLASIDYRHDEWASMSPWRTRRRA